MSACVSAYGGEDRGILIAVARIGDLVERLAAAHRHVRNAHARDAARPALAIHRHRRVAVEHHRRALHSVRARLNGRLPAVRVRAAADGERAGRRRDAAPDQAVQRRLLLLLQLLLMLLPLLLVRRAGAAAEAARQSAELVERRRRQVVVRDRVARRRAGDGGARTRVAERHTHADAEVRVQHQVLAVHFGRPIRLHLALVLLLHRLLLVIGDQRRGRGLPRDGDRRVRLVLVHLRQVRRRRDGRPVAGRERRRAQCGERVRSRFARRDEHRVRPAAAAAAQPAVRTRRAHCGA